MNNNTEIIVEKIKKFTPNDDDWLDLEDILAELFSCKEPELGLDAMIEIYEKYPDEDNDVLWGMLHGIEDIGNYEMKVIESVKRKPSFFGILMINRMLNADINSIGYIDLVEILKTAVSNPFASNFIKEQALRFINRHE